MDAASVRHLDQVSLSIDTKEVGDLSKELEVDGQVAIAIAGPLVLLVLKQPRWNGNNQLHLDLPESFKKNISGPRNMIFHMDMNSAILPLRRARKPLLCIEGLGKAEEAMKEEHSIKEQP